MSAGPILKLRVAGDARNDHNIDAARAYDLAGAQYLDYGRRSGQRPVRLRRWKLEQAYAADPHFIDMPHMCC